MRLKADVAGKVALITGGSGGIGSSTGNLFAENGIKVIYTDIRPEEGEARVKDITDKGGIARFYYMDQGDRCSVDAAFEQITADFGGVDILMNNAGVNSDTAERKTIKDYNDKIHEWMWPINLHNIVYLTQKAVPYMMETGGGSILNVTSVCGVTGLRLQNSFVGSKFALSALTRSMALEYGRYNIRVNALAPGSTWGPNPQYNHETDKDKPFYRFTMDGQFENVPFKRPASSDEMAGLMLYLVSDDASYTTGQVIGVDGGWMAGYCRDY